MKKTLLATLIFVIVALFATTMVNATTGAELPDLIYKKGAKYGVTESERVKMQRYIDKYPVTDEQADQVMAKVDAVVKIFEKAGVTDAKDLSEADLKKVQQLGTEAAAILDVKVVWNGAVATIMHDGVTEEVLDFSDEMPNTGNEINGALVVSSIAVVALTAGLLLRKKFANA